MDKAVLISIQPYWVFLIIAKTMGWDIGIEKNIEVRKDFPKDICWNKRTIIYCSKDKASFCLIPIQYQSFMERFLGKVVGEFVCDKIFNIGFAPKKDISGVRFYFMETDNDTRCNKITHYNHCLSFVQLERYLGCKKGYGWHISELKIYYKPKELSGFTSALSLKDIRCKHIEKRYKTYNGKPYIKCTLQNCVCEFRRLGTQTDCDGYERLKEPTPLTRAPQSWCYCEEG